MASIKTTAAVITLTLALVVCLVSAQEGRQVSHPAVPENAPTSLPDYASASLPDYAPALSGTVNIGKSEPLQSTSEKKLVASNTQCGGASGGNPGQGFGYDGSGGAVIPGSWDGKPAMVYTGPQATSSVVGTVVFSSVLLASVLICTFEFIISNEF